MQATCLSTVGVNLGPLVEVAFVTCSRQKTFSVNMPKLDSLKAVTMLG